MLMDLRTLDWDAELLDTIGVPRAMLAADPPVERGLRAGHRCVGRRPGGRRSG